MIGTTLDTLRKKDLYRERVVWDKNLKDFASNDYLGLSQRTKSLEKATQKVLNYGVVSPKASMLVNGYHNIHRELEFYLARMNRFESSILVGSGFLANIALIESLVRKDCMLFIDSQYHASGILATKLIKDRFVIFEHNNPESLVDKLDEYPDKKAIIAIEGVYSMSGDLARRDIFDIATCYDALLIVDEAHSSGVIGDRLLGIFDYYDIDITPNHIKMGTLGKAYGSYGAYILASKEIISFLENRAKPIIYSTSLSLLDTSLALTNLLHINENLSHYRKTIKHQIHLIEKFLNIKKESLIVPIEAESNEAVIEIQKFMASKGFLVGAIRQPTVSKPLIRVIPNLSNSPSDFYDLSLYLRFSIPPQYKLDL